MTVFQLFVLGVSSFLLLHYFVVPLATKRLETTTTIGAVSRAGTLAAMKAMESVAVVAAIAACVVMAELGFLRMLGVASVLNVTTGLELFSSLRERLSAVSDGWAWFTFGLVALAVLYTTRRTGRARMQLIVNTALDAEIERLQEQLNNGQWEEIPPTPEMQQLALLLENVGVDQAVRLGDPEVWREAVRELG